MAGLVAWQKELMKQIAAELGPRGFNTRDQELYRKTPWGSENLFVSYVGAGKGFDAGASLAVRHDAVEELATLYLPVPGMAAYPHTCTVGAEFGNVTGWWSKHWRVSGPDDIPKAAASIVERFDRMSGDWYQKFAALEAVLEVLSGDGRKANLHSAIPGERAKRAIATAFVLGRRETFEELVQVKTRVLEKQDRLHLPSFLLLAEDLRNRFAK